MNMALFCALVLMGIHFVAGMDSNRQPDSEAGTVATPNGGGTPDETQMEAGTPPQLTEQILKETWDSKPFTVEVDYSTINYDSMHMAQLEHDFGSIFHDFMHPLRKGTDTAITWDYWLEKVVGGLLKEATRNKLLQALQTLSSAKDYMTITLEQAAADLVLARALDEATIHWPDDLNVMQDYKDLFHYGSLHTFELTLPANMWKDTEQYSGIPDSLIYYDPNLDSYSAPKRLLEVLIGTADDWHKLPAHELHFWRRIKGCTSAMNSISRLLKEVTLPAMPSTGRVGTEGLTDHQLLQERTLTRTWFYWAMPLSVLTRSFNFARHQLGQHFYGYDWSTAEVEIKSTHPSGNWTEEDDNINLHFTARGAIMMALFIYGGLSRSRKHFFCNDPLVLLRFQLPLRWVLQGFTQKTLRLWNRLYFEHSLVSTKPIKLDALALNSMRVFEFTNFKHNKARLNLSGSVTMAQLAATWNIYWKVNGEKNFYLYHHLALPIPLKKLLDSDSKTTGKRALTYGNSTQQGETLD